MSADADASYASQSAQLQTVSALHAQNEHIKAELAKAVHIAQELQRANQVLQSAWNKQKAEADELKESYAILRSQAEAALAAKQTAETECEQLYGQWKSKLESKQAEFESIQQSMVPARELDLIRLQIVQECSAQHQRHTAELKAEVDKYRDLYHQTHHQLTLQTDEASLRHQSDLQDLASIRSRTAAQLQDLQSKNRKLQELVQDSTLPDAHKRLERSQQELVVKSRALAAENADLSDRVTAAKVEAEQWKNRAKTAEQELESANKAAVAAADQARKHAQELATELAVTAQAAQSLRQENLALQKQSEHNAGQAELVQQDLTFKLDQTAKRLAETQQQATDAARVARENLESAEARCTSLQRELEDWKQTAAYESRDHAAKVKALEESHTCALRELEHEKVLALESKASVQQSMMELEIAKNQEISQLQQRVLTVQSELAVLHQERDQFDAQRADLKAEVDLVRGELDTKSRDHHELQIEYEGLQNRFRALSEKEHALQAAVDRATAEVDSMRTELATATTALESERSHFVRELSASKSAHRNDKATLLARLDMLQKEATQSLSRKDQELSAARDDKSKYKKLSLSLKGKLQEILREYAQSKRDAAVAADSTRVSLQTLQKEKEDAERQRDDSRVRFGAVWPAPMLGAHAAAAGMGHTHAHLDAGAPHSQVASATGHAAPASSYGHVDASASIRSLQAQMVHMRAQPAASK